MAGEIIGKYINKPFVLGHLWYYKEKLVTYILQGGETFNVFVWNIFSASCMSVSTQRGIWQGHDHQSNAAARRMQYLVYIQPTFAAVSKEVGRKVGRQVGRKVGSASELCIF